MNFCKISNSVAKGFGGAIYINYADSIIINNS